MASTGDAQVTVEITLDSGYSIDDLDYLADVIDQHPKLNFLSKDSGSGVVTAEVLYNVTVDSSAKTFEATEATT